MNENIFQSQEWKQHQEVMLEIAKKQEESIELLSRMIDAMQEMADSQLEILKK